MKLDALLVSYFLAGNAECFVSPSFTVQKIEGRISFQNCDATTVHRTCNSQLDATARPNQSRKRSRSQATSVKNSTARDLAASSAAADDAGSVTFFFPSRLRETVERLDREPDLKSKSKLLVELGDIFALTESAVLPPGDDEGRRWRPQKVPGCVSEVYVAASVTKGGALSEGSDFLVRDGGAVATRSAVVSIRGTADARLSRGILALLANGLEGQSPDTVLNLRGKALAAAVGLRAGLTDSRINGLGNILGVIQDQVRDHLDSAAGAGVVESSKDAVAVSGPTLGLSGGALDQGRNWGSDASSWSPLPGAGNEVAMLLSGGVDSSVAMRLLQDQGYRIRAFYLKIWLEDELSHLGECPWVREVDYNCMLRAAMINLTTTVFVKESLLIAAFTVFVTYRWYYFSGVILLFTLQYDADRPGNLLQLFPSLPFPSPPRTPPTATQRITEIAPCWDAPFVNTKLRPSNPCRKIFGFISEAGGGFGIRHGGV